VPVCAQSGLDESACPSEGVLECVSGRGTEPKPGWRGWVVGRGFRGQRGGHEGGVLERPLLPWANFPMALEAQGNSVLSPREQMVPGLGEVCLLGILQSPSIELFCTCPGASASCLWRHPLSLCWANLRAGGSKLPRVLCGKGTVGCWRLTTTMAEAKRKAGLAAGRQGGDPLPPQGSQLGPSWALVYMGRLGEAGFMRTPSIITFGHLKGIV
jgi:hypothetical protein